MSCLFSPEAENDLIEIALRIAADNPSRALTFAEELPEHCQRLALNPGVGRKRLDLHPGLRSFAHGMYLIFYTGMDDGIRVERIIHGARDLYSLFEN